MKVQQFYNKNQFIITDKDDHYLQSYDSVVAKWNYYEGLTLGSDWDYSNTTRKHLYLFIDEFAGSIDIPSSCRNKRAFIQKLIDDKVIKFDKTL